MRADPESHVLRAQALHYRYPAVLSLTADREAGSDYGPLALDGIDLEIGCGEMVVLAGLSGSGKTSLIRAACGLVPHFHGGWISGRLEVAGLDVSEHGPAELATEVGLVAQDPESQVVSTTVGSELRLPLELRGVSEPEVARAVEETAISLGIDRLLERQTATLSGGELQRVALGAAMVTRPSLLLLDEATSQLDPVASDELIGYLRRLNEDFGVAVICCEHRLGRCLDGADRAIAMRSGRIAFDGSPDDFLEWSLDQQPELATPAAVALRAIGEPAVASRKQARESFRASGRESPGREAGSDPARESGDATPVISISEVEVDLDAGESSVPALSGASVQVLSGERVALMGANGAGKTTLMRVACGLIEPDRGSVAKGPEGVAMLPQRPTDMLVRERVGDELPGAAGKAALALVGLEGYEERDPRDLSGGERQRLAVALVIAGRSSEFDELPSALLLDEPTRGMDTGRKADLAEMAGSISDRGCAVVIATHDVEFAASFADRVVLLSRGKVIADGTARDVLTGGMQFSTEVSRLTGGLAMTADELQIDRETAPVGSEKRGLS